MFSAGLGKPDIYLRNLRSAQGTGILNRKCHGFRRRVDVQTAVLELRIREPVAEGEKRLFGFGVEPFVSEAHAFIVIGNEALPFLLISSPSQRISAGAVMRHAEYALVGQVVFRFCEGNIQLAGSNYVYTEQ